MRQRVAEGGDAAVCRLIDHRFYREAKFVFVAPDNCLDRLRLQALMDGKTVLMTTYAIRRGFWVLDPKTIAAEHLLCASTLDGMVTGTGAINLEGVRFGKGHSFFDAEWGMLYKLGRITTATPSAAVVHDCQVLGETLTPDVFDTVADVIFTPTRTLEVADPHKPTCGILCDRLDPHRYETIPPPQQVKAMGLQQAADRAEVSVTTRCA